MIRKIYYKKGFVSLLSVLILLIVSSILIILSLNLQIDNRVITKEVREGNISRHIADSCIEYSLNKLKLDINYIGNETLSLFSGTCQIYTITGNGNTNRRVQVSGTYGNNTRKVIINISQINPALIYLLWQEENF